MVVNCSYPMSVVSPLFRLGLNLATKRSPHQSSIARPATSCLAHSIAWRSSFQGTVPVSLSLNSLSVQYCTDICAGKFYNYHIELHTFRLCFFLCVSLKKMNLFDHRLAAILQIRTVLAARMFELRDLRRRVQTAQLNPRRRRRARSKTALFKSLDAESIDRPQRVGLAKWRVRCGRRLRPRLK
jgi:hypothetical protein